MMILDDPKQLKKVARAALRGLGIYHDVEIEVVKLQDEHSLACYKGGSQFDCQKPIFCLSPDMEARGTALGIPSDKVIGNAVILHYGYVIYEYVQLREKDLFRKITDSFSNKKDFAENLLYYAVNLRDGLEPSFLVAKIEDILDGYLAACPWLSVSSSPKSDTIKEYCKENNIPLTEIEATEDEAADLRGFPALG